MRVLWFTNTPSLASERLGGDPNLGGWISSLEKQISKVKEIELGIAFPFGNDKSDTFLIDRTCYFTFPYPKNKGILRGLRERWRHTVEPENSILYYISIIEQFKPDLIHIFGSERSYGLIINKCNIPIIIQIQGNLTVCTAKWFSGISLLQVLKHSNKKNLVLGSNIFHEFYLIKRRALRERKILAQCKYIIGRTDWDRRLSSVFAPDSKYYHCEELLREEFYHNKWSLPKRDKILIFSTLNATIYKGLEVLLKTAWLLKETNRTDFEWHVAGVKGTEEIISIIEKSLNLKFKNNNVKFKSSLTTKELNAYLLNSNCYVHPSHIENSPNSVCEAMIIGVPVIATYAGGIPSIVKDGVEGILVQDGDPYALTGAILELLGSMEMMKRLSENARQRAILRHNPSTVLKNVIDIYNNILST